MDKFFEYNINPLVVAINKEPSQFTKKDIIDYVIKNGIRIINFRYVAADGNSMSSTFRDRKSVV